MARRTAEPFNFALNGEKLASLATSSPMRLLKLLPDIHPSVGLALWNALRMTCPINGLKLEAEFRKGGKKEPDEEGTAALEELFDRQPPEVGKLHGLQIQLTQEALLTGLCAAEAVPWGALKGVYRTWPIDSLSLGFGRKGRSDDLTPYQYQIYADPDSRLFTASQWVELSPERLKWRAVDPMVDEPNGRAPYGVVINEVIADIALIQDLHDAVHNSAWPRIKFGFNFAEMHKVAVEVFRMSDPIQAAAWVQARFNEVVQYAGDVQAGDNIVTDTSGDADTLSAGSFAGLEPVLTFLRQRIVQALKSLPTLMGINDGSTQTYTSIEWKIYAQGLESIRAIVASVIEDLGNTHLRLLGLKSKCRAIYEPIQVNDVLQLANAKNVEIKNEMLMYQQGWTEQNEGAKKLTGHAAATPEPRQPVSNGLRGDGLPSQAGTSRDEQKDNQPN